MGRANFGDVFTRELAARGATVVVYLDAIIDNSYGRYHQLLLEDSSIGPVVGRWPGGPRANKWGMLTDFRPGSVLQAKFGPVLELIARENPHVSGIFLDDLGTRSWFPGVDFEAMPEMEKADYRAGAIELVRTARRVADRYGLALFVNGTWSADDGGGYPDPGMHGCALVDGGVIEHHGVDEIPFFAEYAASPQWGAGTPRGIGYMWTINDADPATRAAYVAAGIPAFATSQVDRDTVDAPWSTIRDFGLPRRGCPGEPGRRLDAGGW
ncbi:hypothetical protein [Tomitella fengzijianii]|uniref:hypothetical protein n=1 Tax=Tomitella fengzijianii TaxID=2597660 RepID=UPI0020BF7183|nr:hypothetical protein [Tomitella fengzijianii]